MGVAYDRVYAPDGLLPLRADYPIYGVYSATYAGGSTTASVAVLWTEPVETPYGISVTMLESAYWYASSVTALGFTLNIVGTSTLTGETVKVLIYG